MDLLEHCRGCARYLHSCIGMSKEVCEQHNLRIPITNADRIRSMSDEELAEFLWSIGQNPLTGWTYLNGKAIFHSGKGNRWLDWLRQEVDNG